MTKQAFKFGDLVVLQRGEWAGRVGVISKPVSESESGHLLMQVEGSILGVPVSLADVTLTSEGSVGFAQLGYQLIKLGSHVIEKKLIDL